MNIGALTPSPNAHYAINRPQKITDKGNLYRVQLTHQTEDGQKNNFEVWTTREAVQKHFEPITGNAQPRDYQLRKFAKLMYEKQMRSHNGVLQHKGILVTTDHVTKGDPKLWPHTLSHPEIKY